MLCHIFFKLRFVSLTIVNIDLGNGGIAADVNGVEHRAGSVKLLASNACNAKLYTVIYLVDLAAGIEAIVVRQSKEIIALLAHMTREGGRVALTVRTEAVSMKIPLERYGFVKIGVKREKRELFLALFVNVQHDDMLGFTLKCIGESDNTVMCYSLDMLMGKRSVVIKLVAVDIYKRKLVFLAFNEQKRALGWNDHHFRRRVGKSDRGVDPVILIFRKHIFSPLAYFVKM